MKIILKAKDSIFFLFWRLVKQLILLFFMRQFYYFLCKYPSSLPPTLCWLWLLFHASKHILKPYEWIRRNKKLHILKFYQTLTLTALTFFVREWSKKYKNLNFKLDNCYLACCCGGKNIFSLYYHHQSLKRMSKNFHLWAIGLEFIDFLPLNNNFHPCHYIHQTIKWLF